MDSLQSASTSTKISIASAAIAVVSAAYITLGSHHQAGNENIGFVDMQVVIQQSDAGKSLQNQVAPKQTKLKQAAEDKLKDLKHQQETLATLPEAQKAEKAAALQKQINDWNAEAEKQQAAINVAVAPAAQQINKVMHEEMEVIAAQNNYTAILPMQSAFYVGKGVDVTSEAIRHLNAKLSKVDVDLEESK